MKSWAEARRSWQEIVLAQNADVVVLDQVLTGDAIIEAFFSAAAGRLLIIRTDWTESFALLDYLLAHPGVRHFAADRLHLIL